MFLQILSSEGFVATTHPVVIRTAMNSMVKIDFEFLNLMNNLKVPLLVIASAAKQSHLLHRLKLGDCFVASLLAMTL